MLIKYRIDIKFCIRFCIEGCANYLTIMNN